MGAENEPVLESKVTTDLLTSTISSNHEDVEPKLDASPEEIRSILEVIAATGKFWHDWDGLKKKLSFQLKQVLAEYPEARIGISTVLQQNTLPGETYAELVKGLDEALLGFIEGPPFTLQRLCEILLNPKSTYRCLSKLALALEKNLLVTSTLTICTDPYPATPARTPPEAKIEPPNGISNGSADADEEMVDAEADEDPASKDTEMREEKGVEVSRENLEENSESISFEPPFSASEQHNSTTRAP